MYDDHDDMHLWMRDWMAVGAITSTLAPLLVHGLIPLDLGDFILTAAVLGGASGLGVGWLLRSVLAKVPRWSWVSVSLFVGVPVLGAWGALVAVTSAALTTPQMTLFALPCGSISALLQCGWVAPFYAWLAVRRVRVRLPFVLAGTVVGGPVCGLACLVAVLGGLELVQVWF